MEESRWFAGVDTHADTHALCVVDEAEHVVYTGEFAATRKGFAALERALKGPDKCVRVAIEACGSYGRGLAEHLRERGYEVVEALRPGARAFSPDGKTDAIDAERDAKLAARGQGSRLKGFSGPAEALSFLIAARDGAVAEATALSNSLLGLVRRAPADLRERFEKKRPEDMARAIERSRTPDDDRKGVLLALKSQVRRWRMARKEADALEAEMARVVKESYRRLLALPGVSVLIAASIAAIVGDDWKRIRSEAALAKMFGACPIPASSGKTTRHRLFRGGNRAGNCALHRIVVTRLACDERTQAYMERKTSEGKTKSEVIRCLVRYVAREVYNALMAPEPPRIEDELKARRKSLRLTLKQVSGLLSTYEVKISRLERGLAMDASLMNRYDELLSALEKELE